MSDEADEALNYLQERGFEVRFRRRKMHADLMRRGKPGEASFYAEGREYVCVDLLRDGAVVHPDIAVGETEAGAVVNAKRWYVR